MMSKRVVSLIAALAVVTMGFSSMQTVLASSAEDQYLVGDWDGDGKDNIAVRRGNTIYMDTNFDGKQDKVQSFGNGNSEDQYLVGDWDGDGKDNIAVRRGATIYMDTNFDGAQDKVQSYGNGNSEDQYLVGDWNGDRKDNIAVRRGATIYMDTNFDGAQDKAQSYGNGNSEDQYLVGDWNGDKKDNIAVRRGATIHMDTNFDGAQDKVQSYGNGTSGSGSGPIAFTPKVVTFAESKVGTSFANGYCLRFVRQCFEASYGFSSSACCANKYGSSYIDSTSRDNIPLGADVFFGGSSVTCGTCKNKCGHVGIYVGNGYIIHGWNGKIVKTTIDYVISRGYPYRGWGYHSNVVLTN